MRRLSLVAIGALATLAAGCAGTAAPPITPAPTTSVATIAVGDETFRVRLTTPAQVAAARAAQAGGPAGIPNGRIVAGTDVHTGWTWHPRVQPRSRARG